MAQMAMITRIGLTWNCVTKSFNAVGISVKFRKFANSDAPITMVKSMAEVRADSTSTSCSTFSVKVPRAQANTKPPMAPTPAASVGVNSPPYMPPITMANSRATPQMPRMAVRRCAQVDFSPGGPREGLRLVTHAAATM